LGHTVYIKILICFHLILTVIKTMRYSDLLQLIVEFILVPI